MKRVNASRGQALVEMLVLLPVILLLLVASADLGKLFAISGKAEIASRYCALRWFRHAPFDPKGALYPEPSTAPPATDVANQLQQIHFAGALDDDDGTSDVRYYQMRSRYWGADYQYAPPSFGSPFWDVMSFLLNNEGSILPMHVNRVAFSYDIPYFPYGRLHPLENTRRDDPAFWDPSGDDDPIGGPYPLFTAKGDFAAVCESFYGDGGENFLNMLEADGFFRTVAPETLSIAYVVIFVLLLYMSGGGG